MEPVKVILDTDIGPDVDDVGALALLLRLAQNGRCDVLAATHCTSSRYGAGCIDVVARAFGAADLPVGTWPHEGFLDHERYCRYNKALCARYENRYPIGEGVPDAVSVLRRALDESDGGVVICAIGPLNNLSALLCSGADDASEWDGVELVRRKVKRLVVMGGGTSKLEWNQQMNPSASRDVSLRWPGEIWYSPAETGWDITTGVDWHGMAEDHPVRCAYALYAPEGRMSWDLTAVWAAVMGSTPYFRLSEPGVVTCTGEPDGASTFVPRADGLHRYLLPDAPMDEIGRAFDRLICAGALPKGG